MELLIEARPHDLGGLTVRRALLGSARTIKPGDVNWMIAGRGIAHSERTSPESRRAASDIHGIQTWVALSIEHEETAPSFEHHPAATIPRVELERATLDVLAGTLVVLRPGESATVGGAVPSRAMLLGGAALAGERTIWWNFVSSSKERIERAKDDWRSGRFSKIPGDDVEFVPLPDRWRNRERTRRLCRHNFPARGTPGTFSPEPPPDSSALAVQPLA